MYALSAPPSRKSTPAIANFIQTFRTISFDSTASMLSQLRTLTGAFELVGIAAAGLTEFNSGKRAHMFDYARPSNATSDASDTRYHVRTTELALDHFRTVDAILKADDRHTFADYRPQLLRSKSASRPSSWVNDHLRHCRVAWILHHLCRRNVHVAGHAVDLKPVLPNRVK